MSLQDTHGRLPETVPLSLGQKQKTYEHRQLLPPRLNFPAISAISKNRPIVADDLPALLRFPVTSADFVQKIHRLGAFTEIGAYVTVA